MTVPRFHLLTMSNPKTAKGRAKGFAVAVLHLAPGRLSGRNVCPKATDGCLEACLNLAGRGGLAAGGIISHEDLSGGRRTNAVQEARLRRTLMLFENRQAFLQLLRLDILRFVAWCRKEGYRPALRLNGTSDLDWDGMAPDLMREVERMGIVRYDYTKVSSRAKRIGDAYRLTFSLAENNDSEALEALKGGMNVAAVFHVKKGKPLPATYKLAGVDVPVIDGDEDDLRFLDPANVIVGLRAKGPAKRDTSGFVRLAA
jgi:hypothetical protein